MSKQPDAPQATPESGDTELADELAKLSDAGLPGFEFIINDDGSVTFVDFPPELLDVAYALNPDDPLVCERRALLDRDGDEG